MRKITRQLFLLFPPQRVLNIIWPCKPLPIKRECFSVYRGLHWFSLLLRIGRRTENRNKMMEKQNESAALIDCGGRSSQLAFRNSIRCRPEKTRCVIMTKHRQHHALQCPSTSKHDGWLAELVSAAKTINQSNVLSRYYHLYNEMHQRIGLS